MAADALEQSVLESKDREQLVAIASALGVKSTSRAKKADLIQRILEQTGAIGAPEVAVDPTRQSLFDDAPPSATATASRSGATGQPASEVVLGPDGEPLADWEIELLAQGISTDTAPAAAPASQRGSAGAPRPGARPLPPQPSRSPEGRGSHGADAGDERGNDEQGDSDGDDDDSGDGMSGDQGGDGLDGDGESRNRRRRRRRNKNRGELAPEGTDPAPRQASVAQAAGAPAPGNARFDRPDRDRNDRTDRDRNDRNGNERDRNDRDRGERNEPSDAIGQEPVEVAGHLDLREEGYGFLRVNGYLASRDDSYIPVKLTRQFGLRKGDHITGLSRPPGRNEKNPALLEVHTVNGGDPDAARDRPRFEDLTPLFPDTKLQLENPGDSSPGNTTARIIDLVSPIGLGQRGLIVSPPKAGKTTIMKTIATSIERNNPNVKLIVLLIDERPEEVTDMRRTVQGEVIASTFDRPSEEHTHIAEMCIERAKRLVEQGDDVVIILDGITRLSRAYNLVAPATGRIMSGGIDAGALYPPKKFFGAARNVEEGGSLTILATALVETNSRMDDAIFEEFKGTGNMELRLDRHLAERRIYPAINVDASSTRHEELLFTQAQLAQVWKLRRVLSGLAADGSAGPGLELLIDRLKTFRTNDEFLGEIGKQPLG